MLKYKKIKGNLVHKTAIIDWKNLVIGKGNIIGPYVVIGNMAQHPNKKSFGKIYIGNKNIFNEYCNVHLPTKLKKKTFIGNNNFFMNSTTIDHDCFIEDNAIFSSNVVLGGNVYVMKSAQFGIRSSVHQNQIIGSFSMIGMGSIVTKKIKVLPGYIYYGRPIKKRKKNLIGLKRNKVTNKLIKNEIKRFKKILDEK